MVKEYDIRWLEGENIVMERIDNTFSVKEDTIPSNRATIAILDGAPCPVPYVLDITELKLGFGDLVHALAETTRGEAPAYAHRNIKELIVITQNPIMKLGAQSLTQSQYGKIPTRTFGTLDEALAYARSIAPAGA